MGKCVLVKERKNEGLLAAWHEAGEFSRLPVSPGYSPPAEVLALVIHIESEEGISLWEPEKAGNRSVKQ